MRLTLILLVFLAGCTSPPKPPSCSGPYRSLNPADYTYPPVAAEEPDDETVNDYAG